MSWRDWGHWGLGFLAGSVLAGYVTLSCAPGRAQSAEVASALDHAAAEYGVSARCLYAIAWRESRYTPWVDNFQGSGARGLMQFMPATYRWMSAQAGYAGTSPYDAWSAAHVAAWGIRNGYLSHWGGC
jgi:soluble lytic murein transglycosylase-like protein